MIRIIFALLLSLTAYAEPGSYSGSYRFADVNVEQIKTLEIVYAGTESGRKRIEILRAQNYICEPAVNMQYRCAAFLPFDSKDPKIIAAVRRHLRGTVLKFGEAKSTSLTSEGIDYKEWTVEQTVEFAGHIWQNYRYTEAQGIRRIFLGEPAQETFLVTEEGFEYPDLGSVPLTNWSWLEYLAVGVFRANVF